jgi:hypothetical protein
MGTPSNDANGVVELPMEYCDEFRMVGRAFITELDADSTLVGACAVHVGIGFMMHSCTPEQIAAWLEAELLEFVHQCLQGEPAQERSSAAPETPRGESRDAPGG